MSGSQKLVTNLPQEPIPIPRSPLRAVAAPPPTPAPPATPLPLSFLPTSLDFSKTKCDTAHHPRTPLHTSSQRKTAIPALNPGPRARDRKTAQKNRRIVPACGRPRTSAMSPWKWVPLPAADCRGPTAGQGTDSITLRSSNPQQMSGTLNWGFLSFFAVHRPFWSLLCLSCTP